MFASLLSVVAVAGVLRWEAPAEVCPSAQDVQARIDASGGLGALDVEGRITAADGGGWRLELAISLDDVSDARVLEDADCAALTEAAVLLVATRLDPSFVPTPSPELPTEPEPEPEPEAEPPMEPEPEPAPEPEAAPEPEPSALAPRPFKPTLPGGLTLGVAAGVGLGSVPTVGFPVALSLGYAWPRLRVALRGRFHAGPTIDLDAERTMRVMLAMGGAQACARLGAGRLEFPICGDVAVGATMARTQGPATQNRGGVWAEAGASAGVAWFVADRVALTGLLGASTPLRGHSYALDGDERWVPPRVAGRVLLGVEFLWPIQISGRPEKS